MVGDDDGIPQTEHRYSKKLREMEERRNRENLPKEIRETEYPPHHVIVSSAKEKIIIGKEENLKLPKQHEGQRR